MARYYGLAERPWIEDDSGGYYGLPVGAIGSVDLAPVGASNWVFVTSDAPFDSAVEWRVGDGDRLEDYNLAGAELDGWNTLLGTSIAPCKLIDALWQTLTTESDPDGEIRAKPIMPTHRGRLNLYLGGHSLIRGERLPKDPTKTPHWAAIQRVVQNDYRAVYESARGGNLHRKFLGAMALKYRLDPEAAVALLTPARGVPRGAPMKPTTTITDNFNRANSTGLGSSSEGWSWTALDGGFDIVSNQASGPTAGGSSPTCSRAESDLSSVDHYAQVSNVSLANSTALTGVSARNSGSAKTCYMGFMRNNSSVGHDLSKTIAGVRTSLKSDNVAEAAIFDIRIVINGSDLALWRDGSQYSDFAITDTAITTGTRTGMLAHTASQSVADDFSAADLVAAGPSLGLIGGGLVGNRMGLVL